MKKLIVILAAACFIGTAFAQVPEQLQKGNILIETDATNVGIIFTNGVSMNISGTGGYFIADKLVIGGGIGLAVVSTESAAVGDWGEVTGGRSTTTTTFNIGAGVRYYFLANQRGGLFATGMFNVAVGSGDPVFGVKFNGGYAFFINRYLSIEPLMLLNLPFSKGSNVDFGIGAGISIYL
ncbi:MAG: hypothetical protein LBK94_12370 [Prevotellaceae bacterium]|jgi:hypothetical protein|nr:hypothetical protein [Prevotellaceae bacterium]